MQQVPSYLISTAYVLGDSWDKGYKAHTVRQKARLGERWSPDTQHHHLPQDMSVPPKKRAVRTGIVVLDTFIWQALVNDVCPVSRLASVMPTLLTHALYPPQASVIIPGFTINRVVL